MSGLIKSSQQESGAIRALPSQRAVTAVRRPPAPDPLRLEIDQLRGQADDMARQLARREDTIQGLKAEVERARQAGQTEGHAAGLRDADQGRAEMLAAFTAGVNRAVAAFEREATELRRLAPLAAKAGLAKVLGPDADYARLMGDVIRQRLVSLEDSAVLRAEVSGRDFPDAAELAALQERVGRPGLTVAAAQDLEAGECRLKLVLGTEEIGVGQQWRALAAALDTLAEPEAAL